MRVQLRERIKKRLQLIYQNEVLAEDALQKIEDRLSVYEERDEVSTALSEKDSILITYGDTLEDGKRPALQVLSDFLQKHVGDAIHTVHILPMYPYTSDDGFSVVDYRKINPELGSWDDIGMLADGYQLMFDAVINHISKSSDWFQRYLKGEKPYTDYFITADPDADYKSVTRPRALPLLSKVKTKDGSKYVWTTFSEDQIDLNFECPDVLAEILDLLVTYAKAGAKFIRLDAIGFLWKELDTSCMHLGQTHEAVKLMKDILEAYAPGTRIITETNVPHKDNISYFGNGYDEADLIYQFPLPPLTMFSLLTGDATKLSDWIKTLKPPSDKTTFFNFLASHDGIGVRPVEGILTGEEQQLLVDETLKNGGVVSYKDNGDGTRSPYELNISYQDALASPEESDDIRIRKLLAAQTILLSMQGVPGIYIHSLLGSRNDYYGKTVSGIPRRINREKLNLKKLEKQLETSTNRKRIFDEILQRLNIRKEHPVFAPDSEQKVLDLDKRVLSLKRTHTESQEILFAIINVSGEKVMFEAPEITGTDLISGRKIQEQVTLESYETLWVLLKNKN